MRVFSHKYTGHWPVGAVNIIVALDREQAKELQATRLKKQGLEQEIKDRDFEEIDILTPQAHVLLDGEY